MTAAIVSSEGLFLRLRHLQGADFAQTSALHIARAARRSGARGALVGLAALGALAAFAGSASADERARICGWWSNPSPSNVSLLDGTTEWVVAQQGAHSALGEWPRFAKSQRRVTGVGSYGYGCACLDAAHDGDIVTRIFAAKARPLSACRRTRKLRDSERLAQ